MSRIMVQVKHLEAYRLVNSVTYHGIESQKELSTHSSSSRISPAILLTTVVVAVIIFTAGIIHLVIRYLIKRPSFSPVYQSNRHPEDSVSQGQGLQRQLQQLFRLHDSGLDQAFVDALPVFCYRDVIGLKKPFDCAVCLCEFSERDRLRLVPLCSHAFHIDCIDTWLLSNSTCPLCRGSLVNPSYPMDDNPIFNLDCQRETLNGSSQNGENDNCGSQKQGEKRVFSVRLGKYRSTNVGLGGNSEEGNEELGETSSSSLDERRCFSMGAFQYVMEDTTLEVVALPSHGTGSKDFVKKETEREIIGCSPVDADMEPEPEPEGKKITRVKGDSFSMSKIWLWSKRKNRFHGFSDGPPSACSFTL